ncbi:hypothetical protein RIF29_16525 [Crotalaria pallida]|uniref:Protein TILLER ANGLE CONTROL 1 n=1 Tax=Crotalaria pallida TaxID=3830 RepID=A0AAN9IEJ8_CROPI
MKIFNWMHKRFHNNTLKDGFASNIKKTEPTTNNADDSQALLKQVALTDLLGGWEDGILTIGTLGYDPVKTINHNSEYFPLETEGEEPKGAEDINSDDDGNCCYNTEHEELNPLMQFEQNFEDDVVVIESTNHEEQMVCTYYNNEIVMATSSTVISHHDEIMESSNDADEIIKKNKGERITLADLFLADSDVKMKLDPAKVFLESGEKSSFKAKHGFSFAKKLIPRVKENPHPMKDIKNLMKKMLKRKIHPDLEIKNHKPEGHEVNAAGIIDNHKNEGDNDSAYFLPI